MIKHIKGLKLKKKQLNFILIAALSAALVAGCNNTGGSHSNETTASKSVNAMTITSAYDMSGSILGAESDTTYSFGTFGYKNESWSNAIGLSSDKYNSHTGVWSNGDKYSCDLVQPNSCQLQIRDPLATVLMIANHEKELSSANGYNGYVVIMNNVGTKLVGASSIMYDEMDFGVDNPSIVATPLATSQYIVSFLRWKYGFSLDEINRMFTDKDITEFRKLVSGTGLDVIISKSSIWYFYLADLQGQGSTFAQAMDAMAKQIQKGRDDKFISGLNEAFENQRPMTELKLVFSPQERENSKRKSLLSSFLSFVAKGIDVSNQVLEHVEAAGSLMSLNPSDTIGGVKKFHETITSLVGGGSDKEEPVSSAISQAELEGQRWDALLSNTRAQTELLTSMYALQKLTFDLDYMGKYKTYFTDLLQSNTHNTRGLYGKYLDSRMNINGAGSFDSQIAKVKETFSTNTSCELWSKESTNENAEKQCVKVLNKLGFSWFNDPENLKDGDFNFKGGYTSGMTLVKNINNSENINGLVGGKAVTDFNAKIASESGFDNIVGIKQLNDALQSWAYKIIKADRFWAQYQMIRAKVYFGGDDGWGSTVLSDYIHGNLFVDKSDLTSYNNLATAITKIQSNADNSIQSSVQLIEGYAVNPYKYLNRGLIDIMPQYDAAGNNTRLGCLYDSYVRTGKDDDTKGTIKVRCQYRDSTNGAVKFALQTKVDLGTCLVDQNKTIIAANFNGDFSCAHKDPTGYTHNDYLKNSFGRWQADQVLAGERSDGLLYPNDNLATGMNSGNINIPNVSGTVLTEYGGLSNFGLAPLINRFVQKVGTNNPPALTSTDHYVRVLQDLGRYVDDNNGHNRTYDWYITTDLRHIGKLMSTGYGNENYFDVGSVGMMQDNVDQKNERMVNVNQSPEYMIITDHATGKRLAILALRFEDSISSEPFIYGISDKNFAKTDSSIKETYAISKQGGLKHYMIGMIPIDGRSQILNVNHTFWRHVTDRCNILTLEDGSRLAIGGNAVSWRSTNKDLNGVIRYELGVLPEGEAKWCEAAYFDNLNRSSHKLIRSVQQRPDHSYDTNGSLYATGFGGPKDWTIEYYSSSTSSNHHQRIMLQVGYHNDSDTSKPSHNINYTMTPYYENYFRWGDLFQLDYLKTTSNQMMDNMIYSTYLTESKFLADGNGITFTNTHNGYAGFEHQQFSDSVLFRNAYGATGTRYEYGNKLDYDFFGIDVQLNIPAVPSLATSTLGIYNPSNINGVEDYQKAIISVDTTHNALCLLPSKDRVFTIALDSSKNIKPKQQVEYKEYAFSPNDIRELALSNYNKSEVFANLPDSQIANCMLNSSGNNVYVALTTRMCTGLEFCSPSDIPIVNIPLAGYGKSSIAAHNQVYRFDHGTNKMFQPK